MNLSKDPLLSYFYVALAASLWGLQGGFVKILFQGDLTPQLLVQFRLTISTIILFLFLLFLRRDLLRVSLRDIPLSMSLGIGGIAMNFFLYYYSISKAPVAVAIFLQYLAPALIAAYSCLFMGEKFTKVIFIAIAGSLIGCFLVVKAYDVNFLNLNLPGVLGGLGAAVTWAWWSLHAEYIGRRYDPFTMLFYALVFASLFWNLLHSPVSLISISPSFGNIFGILYVAIFATIVPFWLFFKGLKIIRATRASITSILEPLVAVFSAYLFLGEGMSAIQLLGAIFVIASIIILQVRREIKMTNIGPLKDPK